MSEYLDRAKAKLKSTKATMSNPETWSKKRKETVEGYAGARPYAARAMQFGVPTGLVSSIYSSGKGTKAVEEAAARGVEKGLYGTSSVAKSTSRLARAARSVKGKLTMPIVATTAAMGLGVADKKLENISKRNRSLDEVAKAFKKTASVEAQSAEGTSALVRELLGHSEAMHKRTNSQLKELFPDSHKGEYHGRARSVGMPASEVSKLFHRALK